MRTDLRVARASATKTTQTKMMMLFHARLFRNFFMPFHSPARRALSSNRAPVVHGAAFVENPYDSADSQESDRKEAGNKNGPRQPHSKEPEGHSTSAVAAIGDVLDQAEGKEQRRRH